MIINAAFKYVIAAALNATHVCIKLRMLNKWNKK